MLAGTVSNTMELNNAGIAPDSSTNNGQLDSIGNSAEWGFPSTIVEGGYMSNSGDMSVIGADNEEGLKKYAKGIAAGILQYYGIENRGLDGVTITSSETTTTTGVNSRIYDLRYVEPEVFDKYVKENDRKALRAYTLKEETKKLIIANWSFTTEEGIKIEASDPINFRSVVNKYTMPIEYMIDMLVHTDDPDMVGKLADLAIHSEYIIAIQDNVTTVQTTVDIQEKDYTLVRVDDNEYWVKNYVDWHTISKTITVKETVSNKIELTYADSWFVRFSKTSSYATASFNQNAGNDLTADEGDEIGDFKVTVYCAACNDPPGSIETASGNIANANHTIAVHDDCFNGDAMDGKLKKGSQVIINGQVYTVDDTGDPEKIQGENWIGIFCESPCEEHGTALESGNGTITVYAAQNVKENDVEADNKNLKGLNVTADVLGKVDDTTTVMEEYLGETRTPTSRRTETDVAEQKKITTVRTISNEYDSGKEEIIDQDLKDQQFIDVFLSCEGILRRFNMNLMEEMLAQDEKTVNMIDLTKYLYNKANDYETNTVSGATYNFDVYKRNDLYNIYGSSNILEEFIKSLINNPLRLYMSNHKSIDEGEIEKYITLDVEEPSYILYANEYGGRGFGFDIFHRLNENDWNSGKPNEKRIVEHYEDLSIDIMPYVEEGQTLETETVDQVMRKEIQKWRNEVEAFMVSKGIKLEEYQIDALTVIAYEYGWSLKDTESFINAYQGYYLTDNKEAFKKNFSIAQNRVRPFQTMSDVSDMPEEEQKQQMKAKLTWHLFDTGEYKTPEGEILDPDSFHGKGEILGVAEECWKEVCDKNPVYSMTGCLIPWDSNSGHIDCSAYVSWVLYEYGVVSGNDALAKEFEGGQHSTETLKTVDWDKMGFEVIPVGAGENVVNQLQPGDILDRSVGAGGSGHVQIIVEVKDGVVYTYDAGNRKNWTGRKGKPYISNFAAADSKPGIIIRKR